MAVEHMDNWSIYGNNDAVMVNGVYAEAGGFGFGLVVDPDGVSPGRVVQMQSSAFGQAVLRYVMLTAKNVVGTCHRIWMNNLPVANNDRPTVCSWRGAANNELASLIVETTGRLTWSDGVTSITTTNPVITANGWWHIECKYTRSGVGAIEIRVEGAPVIADADLGYVGAAQVYQIASAYFGVNLSNTKIFFKDFVVWDDQGAFNTDFLGSVIVYDLETTADVDLNWTPSAGANGFSILENAPPNDAEYLSAPNPPPAPYVAIMSDLPDDVTSVKALMTMVRAAKTDGGDASLQMGIISDPDGAPATTLGADRPITIAQSYWRDVLQTDPKTGALWLPSAVNDIHMQMDRTA